MRKSAKHYRLRFTLRIPTAIGSENTNGLLRQYFPNNTDFKKVGQIEVKRALMRLNYRPRLKTHVREHRAALAA
ncbi:MAG: hypothetical protein QS721_01930 [Candidatus Endonucleobacter sp. (ex Gigantidas childressi)]|nr:hypothetical protein [Candidatus Endonucleobacter sp. (ex Gigantidas childressi)]